MFWKKNLYKWAKHGFAALTQSQKDEMNMTH